MTRVILSLIVILASVVSVVGNSFPVRADTSLTLKVLTGSDDCLRKLTTAQWSLTGGTLGVGFFNTSDQRYIAGMRFDNANIPVGSNITSAHLSFQAALSYTADNVNSKIDAELGDDPVTFANSAAAFDARFANRGVKVTWDAIADWSAGSKYESPDISTVIQEVINQGSWTSGDAIVIFWEDYDDRSTHTGNCYRNCISYEGSGAEPELHITYTVPSGPVNVSIVDAVEKATISTCDNVSWSVVVTLDQIN